MTEIYFLPCLPLAGECTVGGLVSSLLMLFRHGASFLFARLVEGRPVQFPAGPWPLLSLLRPELSADLGSSPNLQSERETPLDQL